MTFEEFKKKVDDLMVELNATPGNNYNIGIFVFDVNALSGLHFGMGCAGCMASAVLVGIDRGEMVHRPQSSYHLPNVFEQLEKKKNETPS